MALFHGVCASIVGGVGYVTALLVVCLRLAFLALAVSVLCWLCCVVLRAGGRAVMSRSSALATTLSGVLVRCSVRVRWSRFVCCVVRLGFVLLLLCDCCSCCCVVCCCCCVVLTVALRWRCCRLLAFGVDRRRV